MAVQDSGLARWLAESVGIRDAERWNYLLSLPECTAVVHYKSWPSPFLIEVPTLTFREGGPAPSEWMKHALKRMSYVPGSAPPEHGSDTDQSSPREGEEQLPAAGNMPARRKLSEGTARLPGADGQASSDGGDAAG